VRWRTIGLAVWIVTVPACSKDSDVRQLSPRREAMAVPPQPVYAVEPTKSVPSSAKLLARGAALYETSCAACHGADGLGEGPAAYLLYPKPRNFAKGQFRFVSTWEGIPTDEDLYRSISRGMPGSAMASWAHLDEADRWALVHHVKTLTKESFEIPETIAPDPAAGQYGQGLVVVPPEPEADRASIARGFELFQQQCARCHGPRGQGDGPSSATLVDDTGIPIRPRDLSSGVFKGSPTPEHLYRRIAAGIPGTGMPTATLMDPEDGWHLVHFVRSLSSDRLRDRAEMKRFELHAPRVDRLPDHPDSGDWMSAPTTVLHLMPLWWRYERPEYVTVQALHDGKQLAILLEWADDTHDKSAVRPQDYRDAAAIQFALGDAEPFFAMGEKARLVNIWMWKSEREADLAHFHDIDWQYPNTGIDTYPNLEMAPYEQPLRDALTLHSDPTFITAWGAGNIVADPTRRSPAEDLTAQGFGTLQARPLAEQHVQARGVYGMGSYRVMFRRDLKPQGKSAVALSAGRKVPVAFAIWNGSAGDRDGKKSVSIWQDLILVP
jgi:mono/diheme cytochrome c family protein